jgi:hypothetical protein
MNTPGPVNTSETRLGRWDTRAVPPNQVAAVTRHVWRTKKTPRFFTRARTYRVKIAWASAAVAERPQQHHEHVDEVEIGRQRAHHRLAAGHGAVNRPAEIEFAELSYQFARPFAAPPGVPTERAKALQQAFVSVHNDPQYLDEAAKLRLEVTPIGGREVLNAIDRIAAAPPHILDRLKRLMADRKGGG